MAKKCLQCLIKEGFNVQDVSWLINGLEVEMEANRSQRKYNDPEEIGELDKSYKELEEAYEKIIKLKAELLNVRVEEV